jgi:hypothetical protein
MGFDPDAWEMVLEEELGANVSEGDILDTLRWMQSQGQKWAAPKSARDLLVAMRTRAKQARAERDGPESGGGGVCGLCGGLGWISVWPHVDADAPAADYEGAYVASVPCRCSVGERLMDRVEPYRGMAQGDRDGVDRLRALAVRQAAGRCGKAGA